MKTTLFLALLTLLTSFPAFAYDKAGDAQTAENIRKMSAGVDYTTDATWDSIVKIIKLDYVETIKVLHQVKGLDLVFHHMPGKKHAKVLFLAWRLKAKRVFSYALEQGVSLGVNVQYEIIDSKENDPTRMEFFELIARHWSRQQKVQLLYQIARSDKYYDFVLKFMANGLSGDVRTEIGQYPLVAAVQNNAIKNMKLLVLNGAQLDFRGEMTGWTLLHQAAAEGSYEAAKFLLQERPSLVNAVTYRWKNMSGQTIGERTALMFAAKNGNLPMVKLLVDNNAWLNARDVLNWSALALAKENKHTAVYNYLKSKGAKL